MQNMLLSYNINYENKTKQKGIYLFLLHNIQMKKRLRIFDEMEIWMELRWTTFAVGFDFDFCEQVP